MKRPWLGTVNLSCCACLLVAGPWLVFSGEPASQRAHCHLDQWILLDLNPLTSNKLAFLSSFFIHSSAQHHSVTIPQSLLYMLGAGLGTRNIEVKEAGALVPRS